MAFADDKKLLRRVAARLEQLAKEKYDAAMAAPGADAKQAKRSRDNEIGDVLDLKDLIVRLERAAPPATFGKIFNVDAKLGILVPVDPTPEMLVAGANLEPPAPANDVGDRWKAMIDVVKRAFSG